MKNKNKNKNKKKKTQESSKRCTWVRPALIVQLDMKSGFSVRKYFWSRLISFRDVIVERQATNSAQNSLKYRGTCRRDFAPPPQGFGPRGEIPSDLALPGARSPRISPPFRDLPTPNFRDFALLRFRSSYCWGQKERRKDRPYRYMLQLFEM